MVLPSPTSQSEVPGSRFQLPKISPSRNHTPVPGSCFLKAAAWISAWLIGFSQSMTLFRSFSVANHGQHILRILRFGIDIPLTPSTIRDCVSSTILETDVTLTSNSFNPFWIFPDASLTQVSNRNCKQIPTYRLSRGMTVFI